MVIVKTITSAKQTRGQRYPRIISGISRLVMRVIIISPISTKQYLVLRNARRRAAPMSLPRTIESLINATSYIMMPKVHINFI